jgi:kinesin family protein C1
MDAERAKVAELQSHHVALSKELVSGEGLGKGGRRWREEVAGLEEELGRRVGEVRRLEGEVGRLSRELESERESGRTFKATLSTQTTKTTTLHTQNDLLRSELTALRSTLSTDSTSLTTLQHALSTAQSRITTLEQEAREAEGVRRKLHNMVQELKGNIRVFCRVRPVLSEEGGEGVLARMRFPDARREKREIVLESLGENAMGQERKETYNFGFDRVRLPLPLKLIN